MDGTDADSQVIEYGGVRYDLEKEDEKVAFFELYAALSREERASLVGLVYEIVDRIMRSRGLYAGTPHFASSGDTPRIYGRSRNPEISRYLTGNDFDTRSSGPYTTKLDGEVEYEVRSAFSADRFRERHKPRNDLAILWKDGKARKGFRHRVSEIDERLLLLLRTIAHTSHDIVPTTEAVALEKLKLLVNDTQWTSYEMCGAFVNPGKSGMHYILRKSLPTIAFRLEEGILYPVCALCSHPMGHFADSFCGVLTPTDEVIAHLLMIRADEHGFWKRSTQHDLADPRSGL